ncbi:MAG: DNA polymerase IV, partial [Bacilli bacterium]|nr:DNA polymerase IV [Bacilli bacterium]
MAKIIAHIDLNAFFATCEELRDPSLVEKPVLIGHAGRSGIVSTCNYVARKYGCHSGQPTFQALKACPNAIVIPPDFEYYHVMSNSFFAYIGRFSRIIEAASVDECFVDFTKQLSGVKDPVAYFRDMQFGLLRETGLKCSIGVAPTKWLAKMASDMKKPMGLTFLRRRDLKTVLYPMPIESFWGIGKKTAPELKNRGIKTIGDLAERCANDDPELVKMLGKFYGTVTDWVEGRGSDEVHTEREDPKSIGNSETLMHNISTSTEAEKTVESLSNEVSARAKDAKKIGHTVTLTVKTPDFRLHSKAFSFEEPTNDAKILKDKAMELYRDNYEGLTVRLIGV